MRHANLILIPIWIAVLVLVAGESPMRAHEPFGGKSTLEPRADSPSQPSPEDEVLTKFRLWTIEHSNRQSQRQVTPELLEHGADLARQRRQILRRWIETDPQGALAMTIPRSIRDGLPESMKPLLEDEVSGHGHLDVMIAESFEDHHATVQRVAHVGGKQYHAHAFGYRQFQNSQRNVLLDGIAIDGHFAVRDLEPGVDGPPLGWAGDTGGSGGGSGVEAQSRTQGAKTVLFIRAVFPDDPSEPITDAAAYDLMDQVNRWYVEKSYNTIAIIPNVTPLIMMPQPKTAYPELGISVFLSDAREAARKAGFETDDYDFDIVRNNAVPGSLFNFNGFAQVGGKGLILQNSVLFVAIHELGHNLGLWHANFWSAAEDSVIGPGATLEYGNIFDTMGSPNSNPFIHDFNASFKNQLNWLPSRFVRTVTSSGLHRIHAYDVSSLVEGHSYALRVKKDDFRSYWAEFRERLTSNPWTQSGVLLNWNPWSKPGVSTLGGTVLLDTTPGTPAANSSRDDAPVVVGRTFSDLAAGIHITPVVRGKSGPHNWIDVQIHLGAFPGNSPPSLQLTADQTNVLTGTPVVFNVSAADPDDDTMAYHWDFGDQTFGSNAPTATKSWNAQGAYAVRCTLSDMRGGSASRQVIVTVGSPATFQISGRVTNAAGQPIEGVRVHNGLAGTSYRGAFTDSDGDYVLGGLAPASYTFSAVKYGFTLTREGWDNPLSIGSDLPGLDWSVTTNPVVSVVASDPIAAEGGNNGVFTLNRSGTVSTPVTVRFNLSGRAAYTSDYSLSPAPSGSPRQITLAAGVSSTNLILTALTDLSAEGPETVILTLLEHSSYVLGSFAEAVMTVLDAQASVLPTVSVSATDDSAPESGSDSGTFHFSRGGLGLEDLTIRYGISGTASNGVDYALMPAQVTIPAGQSTAEVPFNALNDVEVEGDESIVVHLLPDPGYLADVDNSGATAVIIDDDPGTVTITATDNLAREGGVDTGAFTVTRAGSLESSLTVQYSLGGTAVQGVDFVPLPGVVTIPAGQVAVRFLVTPMNDSQLESDETVVAVLVSTTWCNVGSPASATVAIRDDESPAISLSAVDASASENGSDPGLFRFTRTGEVATNLTVYFSISGTARLGVDYESISNSIVIPAGSASADIAIIPVDDAIRETNETVVITLQASPGGAYSLTTMIPQTVTLQDNDASAPVGVRWVEMESGALENAQNYAFLSISLSTVAAVPVSVEYAVSGGTATSGVDYFRGPPSPISFLPGQVTRTIAVFQILKDSIAESDETVTMTLSNAQNAVLDTVTNHTYTILDDDASGSVTVSATTTNAYENGLEPGVFRFTRSGVTNSVLTVFFQVTGTASTSSDFLPLGSSVSLLPGQHSVDVPVIPLDDDTDEPTESVILTLIRVEGGGAVGNPKRATLCIQDNDDSSSVPIVRIIADAASVAEAGMVPGSFTVWRDRATSGNLLVQFSVSGSATAGSDYAALSTSVIIPAGASNVVLLLNPISDAIPESNETVVVTLTLVGGYRVAPGGSTATIAIVDGMAPVIATQPMSQTSDCGSNVSFSVVATGSPPLGYQWRHGGQDIPGATAATFSFSNITSGSAGSYGVEVRNSFGSVTSTVAALVVTDSVSPSITCPSDILAIIPAGQSGTVVSYNANAEDACSPVVLSCSPQAGSMFAPGTNLVLCLAMDASGNSNSCYFKVVVNRSPLAGNDFLGVLSNHPRLVAVTTLTRNDIDEDADSLAVVAVSATSTNGGGVSLTNGILTYRPVTNFVGKDLFTCQIGDGRGGVATGQVDVTVWSENDPAVNRFTEITITPGGVLLRFAGIPGFPYLIQRSSDLDSWDSLDTVIAPQTGMIEYEDPAPPGASLFYRTISP